MTRACPFPGQGGDSRQAASGEGCVKTGTGLLDEYRKDVERVFGGNLVSLTVYGSHATVTPDPGDPIGVLLVADSLTRETLAAYHTVAHKYVRRGIPAPPLFTEAFLRESADVFPIEFLAMMERRRVLSGRDVLEGLPISTANLRHQVEFELKGKYLSLARMYMGTFGKKELGELVRNTVGPVVDVARGLLLLKEADAPHGKEQVVDGIERAFDVRLPNIREALGHRSRGKIPPARVEDLFFGYLSEVERLCSLSDRFPEGP
ncbi:MAG: hypothetical protein M1550_07365 [Deltaproteobacteria bacterium]|nr:hypothetical protein [Deltaproteobacteria bacterium]